MKKLFLLFLFLQAAGYSQNDTLFYENFDRGLVRWTAKNLADSTQPTLWRVTNSRSVSPVHSAAWNDSLSNTYSHNRYEAIESPGITIPLNARTFLKFKAFIHLTQNGTYYHDYFFVKYSTNNGTTWNNFTPYAVSGQQLNWRSFPEDFGPTASSELTYYAGKTMKFRIIAASDSLGTNGLGIFLDDFVVYSQGCSTFDPNEPNNNTATATQVAFGDHFTASFCPQNDEDFYKFTAQAGDQINIVTQHNISYTYLYLLNANGITLKNAYNEMNYTVTTSGTYYIRVTGYYNYSADYSIYFNSRPEPDVISVTDIPGDQGLKVRVKWQASFYDPQYGNGQVKAYQLWRKVNDSSTVSWEFITSVPALSQRPFTNYSYVAPTLEDSVLTVFRIAAIPKNETQAIVWGAEGSGFSVDNLAPSFDNVLAVNELNKIKLNWRINNIHQDIKKIEIYKGVHELFPPVIETRAAVLAGSSAGYDDIDLLPGYNYYYIIAATDNAGNIFYSPAINAGAVTSISNNEIVPGDFLLKQNYPNPFNPSTKIEFSLPRVSEISLKVYDVLGREVKELIKGIYSAGAHSFEFDAGDLTSGIYFYKLTAGTFTSVRKMILLK